MKRKLRCDIGVIGFAILLVLLMFTGCVHLHQLSDPSQCGHLDNDLNKDECYLTVAYTMARSTSHTYNEVIDVCDKISTSFGRDECLFSSATYRYLALQSVSSNNYAEVVNICNNIKNKESKNECFIFLATETNDSNYCDYVENYYADTDQEVMKMIFGDSADRMTQQEYCRNLTNMD